MLVSVTAVGLHDARRPGRGKLLKRVPQRVFGVGHALRGRLSQSRVARTGAELGRQLVYARGATRSSREGLLGGRVLAGPVAIRNCVLGVVHHALVVGEAICASRVLQHRRDGRCVRRGLVQARPV